MRRDDDIITRDPPNVESAWSALTRSPTPVDGFYTRNNFPVPRIERDAWTLSLAGFERPATLRFGDVAARSAKTMDVVLECAGNNRIFFEPRPEGTAWRERAVGCARFRGTPLAPLVLAAGIPDDAVELVFRGGEEGGAFERSLPLDVALDPETLLAWEMNGEPLAPQHGAPVRLVVPRWYAVASVKWLAEIRPTSTPFEGHFQRERYVYERHPGDARWSPVREKRVNSLVATPAPDATVDAGRPLAVAGWAWSGHSPIARVEVSTDGGARWTDAQLDATTGAHAWRGWRLETTPAEGTLTILARATDAAGNRQPDVVEWNVHGYGYNAPRPRRVRAAAARQTA